MTLNKAQYAKALIERVETVIKFSGLEISGFAEYTGISESHLYAILNGNREISASIADRIAGSFGMKTWHLMKLDVDISKKMKRTTELNKFYIENKGVEDYFTRSKTAAKASSYIEKVLLPSGFFKSPVYISDVREKCAEAGKKLSSKRVSQILNYLVDTGKLKKKKRRIRLKNGEFGKRIVDVFYQ
ncbi:MAG: helix-turn-helix transcriptional regulator [Flavisolibacter sp.]